MSKTVPEDSNSMKTNLGSRFPSHDIGFLLAVGNVGIVISVNMLYDVLWRIVVFISFSVGGINIERP
jgi:hypothetical protein